MVGGGIGEGYAMACAERGMNVVIAELNEEGGQRVADAINRIGGSALFVKTDVGSEESAIACAQATMDAYGAINYLINNAAIFGDMKIEGYARRGGFRPQLFTVAAGSYALNSSYSSGAEVVDVDARIIAADSKADFRQAGSQVELSIVVQLDAETADSLTAGAELRIRTQPASATEPARYNVGRHSLKSHL